MPDEDAPQGPGERAPAESLESIRDVSLRRRMRGYDPAQTDRLLADVAERYTKLLSERTRLADEVNRLRTDMEAREAVEVLQINDLNEQLSERDARLIELERKVGALEAERMRVVHDSERLRTELTELRRWKGRHEEEVAEPRQHAERVETRERALTGQIAMLEAQLKEAAAKFENAEATSERVSAPDRRAWNALITADRIVEKLKTDARREAELTLKKARQKADVLIRSAASERDRLRAELERLTASERDRMRADLERLTVLEAELSKGFRNGWASAPKRVPNEPTGTSAGGWVNEVPAGAEGARSAEDAGDLLGDLQAGSRLARGDEALQEREDRPRPSFEQ